MKYSILIDSYISNAFSLCMYNWLWLNYYLGTNMCANGIVYSFVVVWNWFYVYCWYLLSHSTQNTSHHHSSVTQLLPFMWVFIGCCLKLVLCILLSTNYLCILVSAPLRYLICTNFLVHNILFFGAIWGKFALYLMQILHNKYFFVVVSNQFYVNCRCLLSH